MGGAELYARDVLPDEIDEDPESDEAHIIRLLEELSEDVERVYGEVSDLSLEVSDLAEKLP
jgi:hypothetical protein